MYFYGFYALKEKEYSNKVLIELSLKTAKVVKADELLEVESLLQQMKGAHGKN